MIRHALLLGAAIAALATLPGCPATTGCPPATAASETDQLTEVLRAVEEWRAAWETRGADTVLGLYAHDRSVSLVTQGTALVGWDQVQPELAQRLARATAIHYGVSDIRIAPAGAATIVTAGLAREIAEGSTAASDYGTLTLVFVKAGTRWVVQAEHFSFRPRA